MKHAQLRRPRWSARSGSTSRSASSRSTASPRSSRAAVASRSRRSSSSGDEESVVGVGYGKANEVPIAIQKGVEQAKKNLFRVPKHGSTITHQVLGIFGSGHVLLKPASPGTGVIAGGGVRAVLELAGIHDILSKSLGTQNPINLVKATIAGLQDLRTPEEVARAARPVDRRGARPDAARRAARRDARGRRRGRSEQLEAEATPRPTRPRPTPRRSEARTAKPPPRAGGDGLMPKVTQIKSQERREPRAARDAALARAAPDRPHGRGQGQRRRRAGMLHRVRHLIKVEED